MLGLLARELVLNSREPQLTPGMREAGRASATHYLLRKSPRPIPSPASLRSALSPTVGRTARDRRASGGE